MHTCLAGVLTPGFKYIEQLREQNERISAAAACDPADDRAARVLSLRGAVPVTMIECKKYLIFSTFCVM